MFWGIEIDGNCKKEWCFLEFCILGLRGFPLILGSRWSALLLPSFGLNNKKTQENSFRLRRGSTWIRGRKLWTTNYQRLNTFETITISLGRTPCSMGEVE